MAAIMKVARSMRVEFQLNKTTQSHFLVQGPQYLWLLVIAYVAVLLLANWFDVRLVNFGVLIIDAGTIIFPLSFLASDLLTEVYGYQWARRAIWVGFIGNMVFMLYGLLITHLPNEASSQTSMMFDQIFSLNARIIIASTISYFICEPVNSLVVAKTKLWLQGRHIGLRFLSSTVIASGLDSIIFTLIAFTGVLSTHVLFTMMFDMWLVKVIVECLGLPISTHLAKVLKRKEQLDVYDGHTRFNLFKWRINYTTADNQYIAPN